MSFSYPGIEQSNAGALHDGACTATAAVASGRLKLANLDCRPMQNDANKVESSALDNVSWKLDGSCLDIGDASFEQKVGECKDAAVEEKFSSVGNAISNAS